ncbi:MAG: AAA family ATPase, partial [Chloroflexota bacterium]|nr:AAA family ATPase [Chloroflexota bacterium]
MKLIKVRVTNFQSIQDSNEFEIDDITCLVGKNEAGKTALLKALYRLRPINEADGSFDVTTDYPRQLVTDYEDDVAAGRREPAQVIEATFAFDSEDVAAVEEVFGADCLENTNPIVILFHGYSNTRKFRIPNINAEATLRHLVETAGLPAQLSTELLALETAEEMVDCLANAEQTEASQELAPILESISEQGIQYVVYDRIVRDRMPVFLYFDEYFQMKGQDNLDALSQRVLSQDLEDSDYPMLGLIELAGLSLDVLTRPGATEILISKLEAAGNQLTRRVLPYWSQNQHLRMKFDIRPALPEDPPGMNTGNNVWGRVENTKYFVSTPLGTRSRGFVWFFSFLAWYQKLRRENEKLILLLDEPGLSLHARAQADLLRYFEKELKPDHQLIYTTHSPFMVDPTQFGRVRIVQDLSIESESEDIPTEKQGTKVITEVLEATPDSLFPLQGALGYEIFQTLFIGPNCLIVEGVSDLIYIQVISALLQAKGKTGLS